MSRGTYEELEDGSWAGSVPGCVGLIAFALDRSEIEAELKSTLEDWMLVGLRLRLGHDLPILNGINLNSVTLADAVDAN